MKKYLIAFCFLGVVFVISCKTKDSSGDEISFDDDSSSSEKSDTDLKDTFDTADTADSGSTDNSTNSSPDYDSSECGMDDCGGVCGNCEPGYVCNDYKCVEDTGLCATKAPLEGPGIVTLEHRDGKWALLRDAEPYYVKGVGGQTNLQRAASSGANSTRTWGAENAQTVLNSAQELGMTVMLGIWLSHNNADYNNNTYKNSIRAQLQNLINSHKNHSALLIWALGNEINLGADTQEAWEFVEELAAMIKEQDSNHPVATVIAGANTTVMNNIQRWAASIDIIGINSYAGLSWTNGNVENSNFNGPYMVTEWGPDGHWEVSQTSWSRPIEQSSASKAESYASRYDYIVSHEDRCLGSYVFLWGQKQERTPTWYGMFAENIPAFGLLGESFPTVDVMQYKWCGIWPSNVAPVVTELLLDGDSAETNVTLTPGQTVTATVKASDPDGDSLTYVWEVLEEPTQLGEGGSFEPRPARVAEVIEGTGAQVQVTAPALGEYRLFVYVLDGQGHVGSANIPFRVR